MGEAGAVAPLHEVPRRANAGREGAVRGAVAGVIGGLVFGASMLELGALESIASLARTESTAVGAVVHLAVSAMVGAVFGLLIVHQRTTAADTLVWGMAYGAFFWFVGPLTLRPLILGAPVSWTIRDAQGFFGSLVGHVVWGAVTGLSFAALRPLFTASRRRRAGTARESVSPKAQIRMVVLGALAGIGAAAILVAALPSRNGLTAPVGSTAPTNWLATLAVGAATGSLYGALVPFSTSPGSPRLGPRVVHGVALGYLAWIGVGLTIVPLVQIDELAWTAELARDRFELLPGYLLFGALVALLFTLIGGSAHFLFSDEVPQYDRLMAGPQRLRAAMRGAAAGVVGGLLFTIVMVQIGALDRVAGLIDADNVFVGLLVHLLIAVVLGIAYGLLFRRQSFDVRSAAGWGLAYGLLWWVLGALTLFPVLLGGDPQWSADAAVTAIPSLIGHLAYGMGLGVVFHVLEVRHNPWWITRSDAEADRTRARRAQVLTSAPALWAFVVFLSCFLAVVLSPPSS